MRRVGFIPVRAGSKRVPHKNFKSIAGKRLYQWVTDAALASDLDAVYVFSDDEVLRGHASWVYRGNKKFHCPNRSKASATDGATTEQAMLEFTEKVFYDEIYLLQATSPMTTADDINYAITMMSLEKVDSVVSVVPQTRFIWSRDGYPNYDPKHRPLSQYHDGFLVENGAIYGTSREKFLHSECRISGNIGLVFMNENTYIEIDTMDDFVMVEALLERRQK